MKRSKNIEQRAGIFIGYYSQKKCSVPLYKNPFPIDIGKYKLLVQSKEDYNSIDVYQLDKSIVVNAKSESAFFDVLSLQWKAKSQLSAEDITITWTTLTGSTEKTEGHDRIIAEIKIEDNGTVILDKKINFMKKAIGGVTDIPIDRTE